MRFPAIALVLVCLCTPAFAQNAPSGELFAGYSYLNVDVQSGVASSSPIARQNANGWDVAPAFNVNRWMAIEGDFAGYYKSVSLGSGVPDLDLHAYSFAGGPRFNYRDRSATAFVHTLVGGDVLSGSISGVGSASQNSIAVILGGGVEWKIKPLSRWAVRGSADYVLTRHNALKALGFSAADLTQNNFRASVGVVYSFGGNRERAPVVNRREPNAPEAACIGQADAPSLGLVGCSNSMGFMVTSVKPSAPGTMIGIKPGDVVTDIDGRPVHTSVEIETAVSGKTTVKIAYMIQGKWLTDANAKMK